MRGFNNIANPARMTQAQKDANDFQWYKDEAQRLDHKGMGQNFIGFGGVNSFKRKKVNYDLFNNIINPKEFAYVVKPFADARGENMADVGELPADFKNRDITSGKIKVLLGMEMDMPFSYKVIAVNEEATTRKEQEEFGRIKKFVTNEIMTPIEQAIQRQVAEQTKGQQLTPDEQAQLEKQIAQERQSQTPDEVRKYMIREHQDPAEIMSHQILEYLLLKEHVKDKFNKGWKHSCLSGEEIYWVGIVNGEPAMRVINPLYFDYDKSPDLDYIEEGEWARYEYRMTPSEVISEFGSKLKNSEIDRIYQYNENSGSPIRDADFTFTDDTLDDEPYTVRVVHLAWKALRKMGWLTYMDENGKEQMKIVDETYKKNTNYGDISIKWDWIPETHEVYKILDDIYVYPRPVPGQHKDLDTLYESKLPYYGAACDSLNSPTTSPMDRMKSYQYFYNILIYRIELLMASDKGKILGVNANYIPKSAGIPTKKFMYFMEANHIAFLNPKEEGNRHTQMSMGDLVKEIDMSLATQINHYIELAEYIERMCGGAIGVTKSMEGMAPPTEAVANNRQNIAQASYIIKPYFELHNTVKANVLTGLLECAKVAYSTGRPRKLSYVLDDLSTRMLTVDQGLLDNSTLGLFVANSSKADNAKKAVEGLAQAAMQNQQATLLDIIKIIRSESITEAEELLEVAEQKASEREQAAEQNATAQREKAEQRADKLVRDEWEFKTTFMEKQEKLKTDRELQKQAMLSLGFAKDPDADDDNVPDVLEVYKEGVKAQIGQAKLALDTAKFEHQQKVDAQDNLNTKEKLAIDKKKANKTPTGK